ncbi:MAG: di-heme enzyme [Bacteroidetes bacterium]|nr:di-heme enzyme [Bacteroidota bacterium]
MKSFIAVGVIICATIVCIGFIRPAKKVKPSLDAEIGRLLFYDTRLSINKTKSCATCHKPELAFTDGEITPLGAFGDTVKRNTPTLINLADNENFNWANESLTSLQAQSNFPLFGKHPIEMGNDSLNNTTLGFVLTDEKYAALIEHKHLKTVNWHIVKDLIASYVETFKFFNSKYDLYKQGKVALTKDEMAGKALFFGEKLNCKKCHSGNDFDQPEFARMNTYQNIGLYCIGSDSLYANDDNGLYNETKDKDDIGKFKIPSLRNVMLTAPYFHDGTAKNIDEVIEHYKRGGRLTTKGKNAGDGKLHPNKNDDVNGFTITAKEQQQLKAFLNTLTDTAYLKNKFYKSPF